MDKKTIFTAGYKNFSFYEFSDFIKKEEIFVVDVRFKPFTNLPFWSKFELEKSLNNFYVNIPEFGNINYTNPKSDFEISNYQEGLIKFLNLMKINNKFILMCCCEDYNKCHRKLLTELLSKDLENTTFKEICEPI